MHRRVRRPSTKLVAWNPKVLACCVFGDLPQYQALWKGENNINRCPRQGGNPKNCLSLQHLGGSIFWILPGPIQADDTLIFKPGDGYRPGMLEEIPSSECWWFEMDDHFPMVCIQFVTLGTAWDQDSYNGFIPIPIRARVKIGYPKMSQCKTKKCQNLWSPGSFIFTNPSIYTYYIYIHIQYIYMYIVYRLVKN